MNEQFGQTATIKEEPARNLSVLDDQAALLEQHTALLVEIQRIREEIKIDMEGHYNPSIPVSKVKPPFMKNGNSLSIKLVELATFTTLLFTVMHVRDTLQMISDYQGTAHPYMAILLMPTMIAAIIWLAIQTKNLRLARHEYISLNTERGIAQHFFYSWDKGKLFAQHSGKTGQQIRDDLGKGHTPRIIAGLIRSQAVLELQKARVEDKEPQAVQAAIQSYRTEIARATIHEGIEKMGETSSQEIKNEHKLYEEKLSQASNDEEILVAQENLITLARQIENWGTAAEVPEALSGLIEERKRKVVTLTA
jgi:hypothetical protein